MLAGTAKSIFLKKDSKDKNISQTFTLATSEGTIKSHFVLFQVAEFGPLQIETVGVVKIVRVFALWT